jgi:FPC/CPF motif-containing protein YcgG
LSRFAAKPIVWVSTRRRVRRRFPRSPVVFAVVFRRSSQFKDVLENTVRTGKDAQSRDIVHNIIRSGAI